MTRQLVDLVPKKDCSGALTLSVLHILVGTPQPTKPVVFSIKNLKLSKIRSRTSQWKYEIVRNTPKDGASASSSSKASTKDLAVVWLQPWFLKPGSFLTWPIGARDGHGPWLHSFTQQQVPTISDKYQNISKHIYIWNRSCIDIQIQSDTYSVKMSVK